MNTQNPINICQQRADDHSHVETLLDDAFGMDRQTKASYRLREGEQPLDGLAFVARGNDGNITGCISFWKILIGEQHNEAVLLGPLAVSPDHQGEGLGRALMEYGIARVRQNGHRLILLVGDAPYYARAGFKQVPVGQITFPGPVDYARLLYLELEPGALAGMSGLVIAPSRA